MNLKVAKLTENDKKNYLDLMDEVVKKLPRPEFFIKITDEEEKDLFNKNLCIVFGVFEKDKLIAASSLYYNQPNDVADFLSLPSAKCGEIAHCIVLPEFRGNNLMLSLNKEILLQAKKLKLKYMLATAHPENIASNHSLTALGLKKIDRFMRHESFDRNVYLRKI